MMSAEKADIRIGEEKRMTLQSALITALRFHARDLAKTRHRAAGRKLTTIPATQLSRDADALIPELIE
jgi:hypothetical protein